MTDAFSNLYMHVCMGGVPHGNNAEGIYLKMKFGVEDFAMYELSSQTNVEHESDGFYSFDSFSLSNFSAFDEQAFFRFYGLPLGNEMVLMKNQQGMRMFIITN